MKKLKIFLMFCILVITNGIIFSNAYDSGYKISNLDIQVEVTDKREYKIKETIDVYFNENRHGIKRNIPYASNLDKYKIENITVKGADYTVYKNSDLNIKIGNENEKVIGEKQYVVEYTLSHYQDSEKNGDYVYLNVLGTQWDTHIENFTATIVYPKDFNVLDYNVTDGKYGSTENKLVSYEVKNNTMYLKSEKVINPENGVTICVKFEEGAFKNAPINPRKLVIKICNIMSVILLVSTIFIAILSKFNRKIVQSTVEFYPPEDINPAEMEYIFNNCISDNTILSLIYYWANKGYLIIKLLHNDEFSLTKIRNLDDDANLYEKELFNKIFYYGKGKPRVVSSENLKNKLPDAIKYCKDEIKDKYKNDKKYLKENKIYKIINKLVCLLLIISVVIDYSSPIENFVFLKIVEILFLSMLVCLINNANSAESKSVISNVVNKKNLLGSIVFFIIYMIVMGMLLTFVRFNLELLSVGVVTNMLLESTIFITFCSILSLIVGKFIISPKSKYEQEILSRINGFKEFLEKAEKDKLEMLLEEDSEYFYKILPYAQALDITDKWLNKFESIAIPESYNYEYKYIENPIIGTYALNNTFNSVGKEIISPSTSHSGGGGFSGGGFSGGGSGGGGCSSW